MENILEVKSLSKNYGNFTALHDVSFSVPKGCVIGLLGPNGSGKTTLIKTVMSLITDYSGKISIDGNSPGVEANKVISYLPDKQHVPDWLKVEEAINLFSDFYSDFDFHKAHNMIEKMNIPKEKKIKTLSKGMQEKLQLSLVMSRQAKLYILDEPIAAVDPASRDFIIRTILSNCAEGSSLMISTHIISDIESVLDRAIFLRNGSICLDDNVEEVRVREGKSLDQLFREVFKCFVN